MTLICYYCKLGAFYVSVKTITIARVSLLIVIKMIGIALVECFYK